MGEKRDSGSKKLGAESPDRRVFSFSDLGKAGGVAGLPKGPEEIARVARRFLSRSAA